MLHNSIDCGVPNSTGMSNRPWRAFTAAFFLATILVAPVPSLKLFSPTMTRQENVFLWSGPKWGRSSYEICKIKRCQILSFNNLSCSVYIQLFTSKWWENLYTGGLNFPIILYLVFPVPAPSDVVPASLCFALLLQNIMQCCKKFSYFSQFPPPWESRFLPSLLPPPVNFPPPILPGSCSLSRKEE